VAPWTRRLPPQAGASATGEDVQIRPGRPDEASARAALAAMEKAARGCSEGRYAAVVTGPISKARCAAAGFPFPGQTEFFAARWGGRPTMAFAGERLLLTLATWHLPLAAVPQAVTDEAFTLAVERADWLRRRLERPGPIGVCALNPHAGEGGLLGTEERDRLDPLLERLGRRIPGIASGCQPADTLFARAARGEFSAVAALYHDQGLGPLKALEFETAVNLTLGLPYVRTSPDHGTAFGIAGRGTASLASFKRAILLADRLARSEEGAGRVQGA